VRSVPCRRAWPKPPIQPRSAISSATKPTEPQGKARASNNVGNAAAGSAFRGRRSVQACLWPQGRKRRVCELLRGGGRHRSSQSNSFVLEPPKPPGESSSLRVVVEASNHFANDDLPFRIAFP